MSYQANSPDNRRLSSFRIDDILAPRAARLETSTRTLNPCTARSPPTSPQYQQNLSFGVEQILTRNDKEHKGRTLPYHVPSYAGVSSVAHGACDHLHSTFWRSPYLTTHAQPYLYGSLHSSCDTCYDYGAYSYMNDAFAALYSDYNSAVISKSQLTGQPLAGQPKPRKPRRPWTRAVFSNLQRKGLEKRFQVQKYLTKADRHQLASMLGLSDNQVKVWFQNRRMKWRQEARETVASGSSEEAEKQK